MASSGSASVAAPKAPQTEAILTGAVVSGGAGGGFSGGAGAPPLAPLTPTTPTSDGAMTAARKFYRKVHQR